MIKDCGIQLGKILGVLLVVLLVVHVFADWLERETLTTPAEIYIRRASFPMSYTEYSVDRHEGKEKIYIFKLFGTSEVIEYERECECITRYSNIGSFAIFRWDDGTFHYYEKELSSVEITAEEARPYLEKALAIRNATKARFASILKEAKYE